MTVVEQARAVMVAATSEQVADKIIATLATKRIGFIAILASKELFTRWHAHARFVGEETGYGYDFVYEHAIAYAMERGMWKFKILPQTVVIAGEEITVDIKVPGSTTKASNKELLCAYEDIVDMAGEHKIVLPETGGVSG